MKVKIFNGYKDSNSYKMSFQEAEDRINDFIKDKNVLDIKVSGAQCDYGWEMFQYIIMYKEED